MPEELHSDNARSFTLYSYLAVLRRRKRMVTTTMIIVPISAALRESE
jgi:hypothetical protein